MRKILGALLTVFLIYASAHAADKVRIAYSAGTGSFLFLLAHKKGFLKAEGVDAEVIRMTGNVPVAALVSGEIDYHTTLGTSVRAAIQGLPLRVVAAYGEGSSWVLASRSNIKSVPELKGKVIAVGNPGSGPDTNGRIMVKHLVWNPIETSSSLPPPKVFPKAGFSVYSRDLLTQQSYRSLRTSPPRRWV